MTAFTASTPLTPLTPTLNEALASLVGRPLSSVEFVHDYLQLRFDGPTLTAYSHLRIEINSGNFGWTDAGYGDAIRSVIGKQVSEASLTDSRIVLGFDNLARVSISLLADTYEGLEAIEFRIADKGPFFVA